MGTFVGVAATDVTPSALRAPDGFLRIGDYAPIGDGHTVALVGRDGSIDWLCLPTFSDASVFAAVLDPHRGGRFVVQPAVPFQSERRYVPHTNVLETTFTTAEGSVRLTDAMPLGAIGLLEGSQVVRRVEGLSGAVPMRWVVEPRFDYGREAPHIERRGGALVASAHGNAIAIQTSDAGEPEAAADSVSGEFTTAEGRRSIVAITSAHQAPLIFQDAGTLDGRVDMTADLWRHWISGCAYEGPFGAAVERSLLALKLLVYEPTGALVAAPTTSLPERIGGERNFDYRFAWVRDLSFALDAAIRTGMREQAHRSFTWLLKATMHTHPRVQPVYRIDGEPPSGQQQLGLVGYRGSRPVNVGNAASGQVQLGNYGDLFATTSLYVSSGATLDASTGLRLAQVADLVCDLWPATDSSIWELGDKRNYTQSKMACWLVLDRALRLAESGEIPPAHARRWRAERERIREYTMRRCWSDEHGALMRDAESDEVDASTLLAARMEFVPADSRELKGTIGAIRARLGAGGPLLYRYTGMQDEEGAFVACSFWLAEALSRGGGDDEAAEVVEGMLGYVNDVGLLSEEIDPASGELRGNFPQGLSHQALLNACASIEG